MGEIRRAEPEGAGPIARLVAAAYGHYPASIGVRPRPLDDDYHARIARKEAYVVAGDEIEALIVLVDEKMTENRALYARLGYEEIGAETLAGRHAVWMRKRLTLARTHDPPRRRQDRRSPAPSDDPALPRARSLAVVANPFPSYLEMKQPLPLWVWHVLRAGMVAGAVALVVLLFARPRDGLIAWWLFVLPCIPLLLMLAPGIWRNVCPMAAVNQYPRLLGFTRGKTVPDRLLRSAFLIQVTLYFALISTRAPIFDHDGRAVGALMIVALGAAFTSCVFPTSFHFSKPAWLLGVEYTVVAALTAQFVVRT